MKYNILIMLLSVLCLFGCSSSESEPQSVAFSFKEQTISSEIQTIRIPVLSNCAWTINEVEGSLIIETPNGEGNMDAIISVRGNKTFDDIIHTAAITSEDGSSTDRFYIHQKGTPKLEIDYPYQIKCEGGNVDIKISTNENITSITTPDWLKQTSSRGMKDFTYSFNAESNKTGHVRHGTITINSEYTNKTLNISQDSYEPVSVDIPNFPERADTSFLSLYCYIEPEYADWSKLVLEASHSGSVKMEGNNIQIKLKPGYNSIMFHCNHKNIYNKTIKYFPDIEMLTKVSQCVLISTINGKKYSTTIQADISMHGYYDIKHYAILDKDNNVILKDDGLTNIVNGMIRIKTDPILLDVDNFKEKIKDMTFEVEFDFGIYADDLESNIIRKKVEYPSTWDEE